MCSRIHIHTCTYSVEYLRIYSQAKDFLRFCFTSFSTISPVIFGTVYSLSLSDTAQGIGFPVDFHLVFLLITCGFLLTMILVSFLPRSLDKKRK